jgi:hypothetical protein
MLILTGTGNAEEGFWTLDTPSRIPRAASPFRSAARHRRGDVGCWMLDITYCGRGCGIDYPGTFIPTEYEGEEDAYLLVSN